MAGTVVSMLDVRCGGAARARRKAIGPTPEATVTLRESGSSPPGKCGETS